MSRRDELRAKLTRLVEKQARPDAAQTFPPVVVEVADPQPPLEVIRRRRISLNGPPCPVCFEGRGGRGRSHGTVTPANGYKVRYFSCDLCAHAFKVVLPDYVSAEQAARANAIVEVTYLECDQETKAGDGIQPSPAKS